MEKALQGRLIRKTYAGGRRGGTWEGEQISNGRPERGAEGAQCSSAEVQLHGS